MAGKAAFFRHDIDTAEGGELSNALGVNAVPTTVFIGADGKELGRVVGGLDDAGLTAAIGKYLGVSE